MPNTRMLSLGLLAGILLFPGAVAARAQLMSYLFDFGTAATPLDAGTAQTLSSDFNGASGLTFLLPLFDSSSAYTLESVTARLTATVNGTVVAYNFSQYPNQTALAFQNAYTQVDLALNVPGNNPVSFSPRATVSGSAQPFLPPAGGYSPSRFPVTATSLSNTIVFGNTSAFAAPGGGTIALTLLSNGGSVGGPTVNNLAFGTDTNILIHGTAEITYNYLPTPTPIPEPGVTAAILSAGVLVGLGFRRRAALAAILAPPRWRRERDSNPR